MWFHRTAKIEFDIESLLQLSHYEILHIINEPSQAVFVTIAASHQFLRQRLRFMLISLIMQLVSIVHFSLGYQTLHVNRRYFYDWLPRESRSLYEYLYILLHFLWALGKIHSKMFLSVCSRYLQFRSYSQHFSLYSQQNPMFYTNDSRIRPIFSHFL